MNIVKDGRGIKAYTVSFVGGGGAAMVAWGTTYGTWVDNVGGTIIPGTSPWSGSAKPIPFSPGAYTVVGGDE